MQKSFALRTVCAFGLAFAACLVASPISLPLVNEPENCSPYEFTCKSGECVSQYNVCDAQKDCRDGDDENITMCLAKPCHPDYPFKCTFNGICIPLSWLCDGHNDCGDNSDEVKRKCVKILHKEYSVPIDEENPWDLQPNDDEEDVDDSDDIRNHLYAGQNDNDDDEDDNASYNDNGDVDNVDED